MTTSNPLTVAVVSASLAERSRSRMAARHAADHLTTQGVSVDFLDLNELELLPYPRSKADGTLSAFSERFNAADAWVLAVPIYNWGGSGVLANFLHYALKKGRRYRPFVLIAGAGGQRSHLALDSLARTLIYEVSAVQVGPAILAAGGQADRESETLDPELETRLARAMDALHHFGRAAVALAE